MLCRVHRRCTAWYSRGPMLQAQSVCHCKRMHPSVVMHAPKSCIVCPSVVLHIQVFHWMCLSFALRAHKMCCYITKWMRTHEMSCCTLRVVSSAHKMHRCAPKKRPSMSPSIGIAHTRDVLLCTQVLYHVWPSVASHAHEMHHFEHNYYAVRNQVLCYVSSKSSDVHPQVLCHAYK